MAWILGIDEAGYGPNLGPFVMSAVACQVPDELRGSCLWQALQSAVRRGKGDKDGRLLIDDSKMVYSSAKGLGALERGVLALPGTPASTLHELVLHLSPDAHADLAAEPWYTGTTPLPLEVQPGHLAEHRERLAHACIGARLSKWLVFSTIVCPPRFNALIARSGTKAVVLAQAFVQLLQHSLEATQGPETLAVFIDKQGGRNNYTAQIQHALSGGLVVPLEESLTRSAYLVRGREREIELTFQPRADQEHFCVALASMVSKYLRELFMAEFNRFWLQHVPGLKATAGYPGDALRFWEAIRPIAATLKIPDDAVWRKK